MSNIFIELNLKTDQGKKFDIIRREMEKEYGKLSKIGTVRMLLKEKYESIMKER